MGTPQKRADLYKKTRLQVTPDGTGCGWRSSTEGKGFVF
jgi:hypothetical protein